MSDTQPTENRPPASTTEVQRVPPHSIDGKTSRAPDSAFLGTERYELLEEIARGGMGVVYKARDHVLDRDVVVKTLLQVPSSDSAIAARFREEARITGQLQHPAIPPVHDLGTLPDGRPFLAMKLIKGNTLDHILKARPDPASERGTYLAYFEQIAQGVAYAHAHRVIHRDLKPSNVMIGAFGEVQVMDWGLAKVLSEPPRAADASGTGTDTATVGTNIRPLRQDSDGTHAGSILGTPAFMPREQAVGAIELIDTWSDVFSLGGILCAILTGQPPYVTDGFESTRQLAAFARLDDCFARLDASGAELDLVALCKRCLSAEPTERPKDARDLVASLIAWRLFVEDRSRQSELAMTARIAKVMGRQQSASAFGAFVILTGAVTLVLCYAIIVVWSHVFR
jgi:eukaryotic-like serine/threonine-protein kinase